VLFQPKILFTNAAIKWETGMRDELDLFWQKQKKKKLNKRKEFALYILD